MKPVVAYVKHFIDVCRKVKVSSDHLSVQELDNAERMIVKDVQKRHFGVEMRHDSSSKVFQ